MKIAVIDIETTGLDPERHQILEIYGYQLDLAGQVWDRKYIFHRYIRYDEIIGSPYALNINAALIKDMRTSYFSHPENVKEELWYWMINVLEKQKNGKITFAGKNVANFDIPFILNFLGKNWNETPISYRTLDPAVLYMKPNDVDIPRLDECMRRAGGCWDDTKAHTAEYDAECVGQVLWQHFRKEL